VFEGISTICWPHAWICSSLVLRDLKDPNGFPECYVRKPGAAAPENDHPMDQVEQGFGQANPNAPQHSPDSRFSSADGGAKRE
jgi:hypothetical protein